MHFCGRHHLHGKRSNREVSLTFKIMGQAKKRGTFEERKRQSIATAEIYNARITAERERITAERERITAERELRLAEEQARVDAMPEEEREAYAQAYRERSRRVGTMIGMATLAGVGLF